MELAISGITLDQVRVFLAVVQTGSFSAAGRQLHRAQSAVSYGVSQLEAALGVALFDRSTRRPTLTHAGQALVAQARQVEAGVLELAARAASLREGVESEVSLALDPLYPLCTLTRVIEGFGARFPQVPLRVRTETLGAVVELIQNGQSALGISTPLEPFPDTIHHQAITEVRMVAVVAPQHPLAKIEGPIPRARLMHEIQLVVTDRSALTDGVSRGVVSHRVWRVADLGAKHAFLQQGLAWGGMPEHAVEDDLRRGRLVRINPESWVEGSYRMPLLTVYHRARPPGPAGRWLLTELAQAVAGSVA